MISKIGNIIPAPGEIRAIAVQRLGPNANKFVVAGNFIYRVPNTTTVYRNIMRLNPNGTIDLTFSNAVGFNAQINALAVDSLDRIVVGGEFTPSRLLRLAANGTLDGTFNPPVPTAAVLALEVDPGVLGPLDSVYVGLNGGTIGGRANFTRLLPTGTVDPSGFWTVASPPPFQTSVNGRVQAIKYAANLFGIGSPGIVVGGAFTQATGGTSQNVGNVALFDLTGQTDFFFPTTGGGANDPVNALAVAEPVAPATLSEIFAGGEFSKFNQVDRPRVAKFTSVGLDLAFSPGAAFIPNPVRALALTTGAGGNFTTPPPFALLHVGGQETTTAFADVALSPLTGGSPASLQTTSPFFPANPAIVLAIAPNATNGALFGGRFLNSRAEKLVATFNASYSPPAPITTGLPSFVAVGPTQFYASALDPNGDLLIAGDVGIPSTGGPFPDGGQVVELYRITPCGEVSVVATFRNLGGYLVRNQLDNGTFVTPPANINETAGQGFRRVDVVSPASIRALAVDSERRIYVGGLFNRVNDVPWNNFVRLTLTGAIDPTFQVGTDDPAPPLGYLPIRKGGPTGFGANGSGLTTVDPETAFPVWNGTTFVAPTSLPASFPNVGEKYNPDFGRVNSIVLDEENGHVYIGGEFKCYNEVPRGGLARIFIDNGQLDQTFGDSTFSLPGVGDYLAIQPTPVPLPGLPSPNLNESIRAYLERTGQTPNTAVTNPESRLAGLRYFRARVNAILLEDDLSGRRRVIVAGLFERANNVPRYNIARFLANGTVDTTFATGPSGTVFPTGTTGLFNGGLGSYINANGALVTNSGPDSNGRFGEIFALGRQNLGTNAGRILIGGAFNRILNQLGAAGNLVRTAFTRFEPTGRHDASFAQLNFTVAPIVRAIAVKGDDRPLIGGPFLIGPRNFGPGDGIGYINNTTRPRIHRTDVDGRFGDTQDPFAPNDPNARRSTWMTVPPGTGQNPNAPLVFQPGPYANSANPTAPGPGIFLGSAASVFAPNNGIEINYYPNLPFNGTPPFGARFVDTQMTVNTITLDPARRRAYIGGLFNTFESVRTDFQNDSAAGPNGLGLDIRWPGVAALQNGSGCSYGLVLPSFPPFQPIPAGSTFALPAMNPAGGQMVIASMTRSAVSLCNLMPTITTNSAFVTIVGAVPRSTNPGFVDIVVSVSANTTGATRTGSITVTLPSETGTSPAPTTFTFDQGLASGCTFSAVAVPNSFPTTGGAGQFQITTALGCAWTITGLPTWISASPTSGSGNATVNFTVAANTGAPRSAVVTVAGTPITISQAGTCTLTLGAPTGTSQPVAGGTGSFTVTTSAGCTYTATSSAPWLVITSGATGGPTGTVNFSVGRNSGAARQATITVTTPG
ncbi:MAG: BACON domain-containing carbohydrate-binding protein, partial [Chloracidobacterium sp.]